MRLGLYGGSFDPFHRGHLEPARAACRWLGLDRVTFLPARRPPHKRDRNLASPFDRYALLALALDGESWAEASSWELEREGTTYAIEQLEAFRGMRPGDEIVLLVGADSLADFPGWHRADEIAASTPIAVLPREPWGRRQVEPRLPEEIRRRVTWFDEGAPAPGPISAGQIWAAPLRPVTISSTELRRRLASGEAVDGEIPEAALRFLRRRGLYGAREEGTEGR